MQHGCGCWTHARALMNAQEVAVSMPVIVCYTLAGDHLLAEQCKVQGKFETVGQHTASSTDLHASWQTGACEKMPTPLACIFTGTSLKTTKPPTAFAFCHPVPLAELRCI